MVLSSRLDAARIEARHPRRFQFNKHEREESLSVMRINTEITPPLRKMILMASLANCYLVSLVLLIIRLRLDDEFKIRNYISDYIVAVDLDHLDNFRRNLDNM